MKLGEMYMKQSEEEGKTKEVGVSMIGVNAAHGWRK